MTINLNDRNRTPKRLAYELLAWKIDDRLKPVCEQVVTSQQGDLVVVIGVQDAGTNQTKTLRCVVQPGGDIGMLEAVLWLTMTELESF